MNSQDILKPLVMSFRADNAESNMQFYTASIFTRKSNEEWH